MNRRAYWALLATTAVVGVILRLLALSLRTEWLDERITMRYLREHGPIELLAVIPFEQPHPPLYYTALDALFALTGHDMLVGQLVSVAAGGLTVVALAWLGSALYSRRVGLLAAVLAAIHPYLIYLSQPMRMYAILGLLSVLTVGAALRYRQTNRPAFAYAFGVLGLASVYTHYFGGFVLATGVIVTAWDRRTLAVLAGQAAGLLPLAGVVYHRLYSPAEYAEHADPAQLSSHLPRLTHVKTMPGAGDVVGLYARFATGRVLFYTEFVTIAIVAIAVAVVALATVRGVRLGDGPDRALFVWAILPVVLGLAASVAIFPMWRGRYYIVAGVGFVLLAARGLDRLPRTGAWLAAILATSGTTWWLISFIAAHT